METVKHKLFGIGEVIKKEGNYITVRFQNDGSEKRFVIPNSFQMGILVAEGSLKKEVDDAIIALSKNISLVPPIQTNTSPSPVTKNFIEKQISRIKLSGDIASAYEAYLIKKGYKTETDDGKPSTVYSYRKAIDFVLSEEHLSWESLKYKIPDVVRLYDLGGKKEHLGNKSNKTVINALKRFKEFITEVLDEQ